MEPEEDFWIHSDAFKDVPMLARTLITTYPETTMLQSHPLAQQHQDEGLFKRSLQEAIRHTIDSAPSKSPTLQYFVSFPARLDRYLVCVVLGLQRDVVDAYYRERERHVRPSGTWSQSGRAWR